MNNRLNDALEALGVPAEAIAAVLGAMEAEHENGYAQYGEAIERWASFLSERMEQNGDRSDIAAQAFDDLLENHRGDVSEGANLSALTNAISCFALDSEEHKTLGSALQLMDGDQFEAFLTTMSACVMVGYVIGWLERDTPAEGQNGEPGE